MMDFDRSAIGWAITLGPCSLPGGGRRHGASRGRNSRRRDPGIGLAAGASAPLYGRHQRTRRQTSRIADRFPVFATGRGGQLHLPWSRAADRLRDAGRPAPLRLRRARLRRHPRTLDHRDAWPSSASKARSAPGRVGVWVVARSGRQRGERKIAAIGIRIRRGVSFHGISLNVAPGPHALWRHRALRDRRSRRHEPRRPRAEPPR